MEQQIENDNNLRSKGHGIMVVLFLVLLLIIAMCGVTSFGYIAWNNLQSLSQKVDGTNFQTQASLSRLEQLTALLSQEQQNIATNLNQLNINHHKLLIYQVNQLVSMADQLLLVYGDIAGCIKLLSYTQNVLQSATATNNGLTSADFVEIEHAIGKDLENLKQIKIIDRANLAGRLDSLIHLAQTLPNSTNYNAFNAPNSRSNPSTFNNTWQKFFTNLKQTLFSLVKVSTKDGKFGQYLTQEQSAIILQSLKLDLLDARVALIQGSQAQWAESLVNCNQLINNYFVVSSPQVSNFIASLSELKSMNVGVRQANIDNTLDVVNKLNEKFN